MTRQRRADLEQHILEALNELTVEQGYPPTYREVASRVMTTHSNVWQAVRHLKEGGFLRDTPSFSARSLLLSPLGRQRLGSDAEPAIEHR